MKPVGEPYAGNPHVRFDERGWETERCRMAQATAPILDSTSRAAATRLREVRLQGGCGYNAQALGRHRIVDFDPKRR